MGFSLEFGSKTEAGYANMCMNICINHSPMSYEKGSALRPLNIKKGQPI